MTKASNEEKDDRELYVLLQGNHYELDDDGIQVERKAGDIIKLTPKQAAQFADKVQSKEAYQTESALRKRHADAIAAADATLAKATAAAQLELADEVEGKSDAKSASNPTVPAKK